MHSGLVVTLRSVRRRACLVAMLASLVACARDTTTRPDSLVPRETSTIESPATAPSTAELSDADVAEILAVVVPAAIAADPDGSGKVTASITYVIADALGKASGVGGSVTYEAGSVSLSEAARMSVEAALSPANADFVAADLTKWMLLIAAPTLENDALVLTYEQRCGGAPDALCGSGGAFRLARVGGVWRITRQLSGWIS